LLLVDYFDIDFEVIGYEFDFDFGLLLEFELYFLKFEVVECPISLN
jgi:hypothetical protein